jgi:predicted  nucleic acid-binding Zn-ribbon protein
VQMQKQKLEHELLAVRQRVDDSRSTLEAEVARLSQDLAMAESKLPEGFRADYSRLVLARGAEALAPLDGGCCGGCYQTVTPQTVNELMMSKPVVCNACGCILYLPEDRQK